MPTAAASKRAQELCRKPSSDCPDPPTGIAPSVTDFGYTMMCEQAAPDQLVRDVQLAERAGFDFSVISDHYQPWLAAQAHSGYAWSILGAAAQATERIPLMTYVTCPTLRYHPAVVAQKAATVQILSGHRFRLGLGSGENLNEHVVGQRWPAVGVRHEMLAEAIEIIAALFDGRERVNFRGRYFDVEQAKLWDLPDVRVPIGVAVSGEDSCRLAGHKADVMIAVEPERELVEKFEQAGGGGKPRVGQIAICYDADRDAAIARAHEQFRWFGLGWKVNADLPNPESFEAATQFVTPGQVAQSLPCGPEVEEHVSAVKPFIDAGFTEVALVQIGAAREYARLRFGSGVAGEQHLLVDDDGCAGSGCGGHHHLGRHLGRELTAAGGEGTTIEGAVTLAFLREKQSASGLRRCTEVEARHIQVSDYRLVGRIAEAGGIGKIASVDNRHVDRQFPRLVLEHACVLVLAAESGHRGRRDQQNLIE